MNPPRLADRLLEWLIAPHLWEAIQGDLHEEFAFQVERLGEWKARWWYWREVVGFVRPRFMKRKAGSYAQSTNTNMLKNHLTIALRNLTKHKVSALINLSGLTLGITACLVIYLITSFELRFDTFHPDSERIHRVVGTARMGASNEDRPIGFIPRAAPAALRSEVAGLETVATFHNLESHVIIPDGGHPDKGQREPRRFEARKMGDERAQIVLAEPQYFDIFRYEWLAGSPETSLNEPYKVVLSERKARLYFGDGPLDQMLGRTVIYRDSLRTTVSGIVRDWTQNTDFTFTDFISSATIRASFLRREINLDEWTDIWSASQTFVKLAPGTTPAQVEDRFAVFSKNHFGPSQGTGDFRFLPGLQPLSDLHFNATYNDNFSRKAHKPTLYGLMGVAAFILLIAATNFINLATARSVQRAQEVGIRKVMGSSRLSLLMQFMSETLILTVLSTLCALLLTGPVLSVFRAFIPNEFTFSVFDPQILLFVLTLVLATALLAGLYPSWIVSAYRPAQTLKGQSALAGNQKGYLRKGLIVFQFTVSLVLIIGTLMVGRQLQFIRDKDLGFSADAVVLVSTPRDEKSAVLAQAIRQVPGVDRVAMQWFPPMGEGYMLTRLTYRGQTPIETDVSAKIGDENFIPLYQLRLVAGRNFGRSDTLRELIINQTYARTLGFANPGKAIGKLLTFNGRDYPIAGVVADFHEETLHARIKPTFIAYLPDLAKDIAVRLSVKDRNLSDASATLAAIGDAWKAVYPDKKFEYVFLDESIARLYEKERKTAQLVNTATVIAIFISCLGLFGLATFTATQRTKEIGVRKVLGASTISIVALLSKDFLTLVLMALLLAAPVAWWGTQQWLQNFAYKIDVEWWVFILAGLLAVGIALLTVSFQSIRAALANPVNSLRAE